MGWRAGCRARNGEVARLQTFWGGGSGLYLVTEGWRQGREREASRPHRV